MLFTLIRNEIRKTLRRGKTWVILGLFAAFLILMAIGNNMGENNMKKYDSPQVRMESLDYQINSQKASLTTKEKELNTEDFAKLKENIELNLQKLESEKKAFQEIIDNPSKADDLWKVKLDGDIRNTEEALQNNEIPDKYKAALKNELKTLQYLKDNNIKPMGHSDFNSYNYFKTLIQVLGMFMLGIGISLFMSDIVSGECTPATLKFLLIQPVSRGKVLLSKFIAVTLVTLAMLFSLEAITFFSIGIFKDFGNSNYPISYGTKYEFDLGTIKDGAHPLIEVANSTSMINISDFTVKALLLQGLFIIACCAFIFMISTIVKSSMISMAISTATLIGVSILNQALNEFRKISFLFFSSYGNTVGLLTGDTTVFFNKPSVTISFGIIVMLVWIIVSYLIAHIIFSKKDILI